jgi:hypothetical protein
MSGHQKEIEEFGKNDDFWLFGYGQAFDCSISTKSAADLATGA